MELEQMIEELDTPGLKLRATSILMIHQALSEVGRHGFINNLDYPYTFGKRNEQGWKWLPSVREDLESKFGTDATIKLELLAGLCLPV